MLPSKSYFNSLECPFYLSSTKCFRPYCHFKHPKRDLNAESSKSKIENSKEEIPITAKPQLPLPPVVEPVAPAPVKHIPIAYIPTKPSAISVNKKKPKNIYIPSVKHDTSKKLVPTADYDPWSVIDSSEKTYSRYSYEKQDYDSEEELFKPLFDHSKQAVTETNSLEKFNDESKSGYDDETDDYPDGAEFSPEEEKEVKEEQVKPQKIAIKNEKEKPSIKESERVQSSVIEIRCKKKRKYAEINASKIKEEQTVKVSENSLKIDANGNSSSPKRIKVEGESKNANDKKPAKKICKYKDKKMSSDTSKTSVEHKNQSSDSKKHSSSSKKHSSEKKSSGINTLNKSEQKLSSSDHKSNHSDSKKSSSADNKKTSSDKKHSSSSMKSTDIKKHSSESKTSSEGSKKSSSSVKHSSKRSSDNKHNSSKNKHPTSSSSKHHSSGKHNLSHDGKKLKTSDGKLKENKNKENSSTKNKESSSKDRSIEKKHDDKNRKNPEKHKHQSSTSKSSSLSKHKSESNKDGKSKSSISRDSSSSEKHKNNLKRKHSVSSNSTESDREKKETILISDSSNNEESDDNTDNRCDNTIVDLDDIFGLSDSDRENNDHEVSSSENEEEYIPKPFTNSRNSPVYKPTSKEDLEEMKKKFQPTPNPPVEEFKPEHTVSKVRIAHVPNVSSLISAKSLISSGKTVPPALQRIVTATHIVNPKIPNRNLAASSSRQRPQISINLDSNIALSIRQPGLNNIYDEFIKFVDYDEACKRAVEEETEICNIATNPQSYRNRIALCILKIRKSKGAPDVVKKEKITSASKPDYTYGLTLYECFSKYLLKPEDYVLHGYPLELPGKSGCVYIDKNSYFRNKHNGPREGPFRKCCNCGQEYAVDEETEMPLTKNDCHHHWGKPIGIARLGKTYTCCKGEIGSEPCHISLYHVTETKNDDCLEGFVRTLPYPSDADPNKAGIYAMDCEMCYSTKGREIVRVSLLSIDNESVYDVLIKPKNQILDYCTRFSGITEEKLRNITTTLPEVQKFVLKMINDKTILVGHSLENDLKALKLIHYNVVDTSLMFPHKEGFPIKCALRTLTSRFLGQAIQTGENGHDSLEDARASLMLVLYQVKEDAKIRKPRVVKQLKSK